MEQEKERKIMAKKLFTAIYGRNLVGELKNIVQRPYLVVTMEDLWDKSFTLSRLWNMMRSWRMLRSFLNLNL